MTDMRAFPPSPYRPSGLVAPGVVHDVPIDERGYMTPATRARLVRFAMEHGRHVRVEASAEDGSLPSPLDEVRDGLDYWVVPGDYPSSVMETLVEWVNGPLREQVAELLGGEVLPLAEPSQSAALNTVAYGRGGYEFHYDAHPLTLVIHLTEHEAEGEFVYYDAEGCHVRPTHPTNGILGDLSQTPHAVLPLRTSPVRVSLVIGYGVPGNTHMTGNDFIYAHE